MKSEFSGNWPTETSLAVHAEMVESGLREIESTMQMPEDERLHIAYGLIAIGGLHSAVLGIGPFGAGKTYFGNLVLGSESRVEIQSTDTEATLFGHPNPINSSERIDGKFKLDPENPIIWSNEISHMANTGPLHRLWDDDVVVVNGVEVPVANSAIYASSNFPNDHRVHELDGALRSRFATEVLFGDASSDFAKSLHAMDLGDLEHNSEALHEGLIPNPKARENLRAMVQQAYPLNNKEFSGFVTDMLDAINSGNIFEPISLTDKRLSYGWQQTARARLLIEGAHSTKVGANETAAVSSLVLPTVAKLNQSAKSRLKNMLGLPKIDPLTEAIVIRRAIADLASRTVESRQSFPVEKPEALRENFRNRFSYASTNGMDNKIDEFIEDSYKDNNDEGQTVTHSRKRRFFGSR